MGTLFFGMSVSVDGYFEGLEGDLSWTEPDERLHQYFNDLERKVALSLYGRKLYENMAGYWPQAVSDPDMTPVEREYAQIWVAQPRVVFSTTLKEARWAQRVISTNVEEEVRRLKAETQGLISVGGANLASSLSRIGLIDEYWLYIHPVLLGQGRRLFGSLDVKINLELLESKSLGAKVLMLRYKRV